MPSPAEISRLLEQMSGELTWLAIGWHLALLLALGAVIAGWRPTTRGAPLLLAAPAFSVAVGSFLYRSPFNAVSFGLLAFVVAAESQRRPAARLELGPMWAVVLGSSLILFGWGYPHFNAFAWYRPLYAAPIGVIPCPTLSIMAGLALVAGGLQSRVLPAVLAIWSAFYAFFGILLLGVLVDVALSLAAVGLAALTVANGRAKSHPSRTLRGTRAARLAPPG